MRIRYCSDKENNIIGVLEAIDVSYGVATLMSDYTVSGYEIIDGLCIITATNKYFIRDVSEEVCNNIATKLYKEGHCDITDLGELESDCSKESGSDDL